MRDFLKWEIFSVIYICGKKKVKIILSLFSMYSETHLIYFNFWNIFAWGQSTAQFVVFNEGRMEGLNSRSLFFLTDFLIITFKKYNLELGPFLYSYGKQQATAIQSWGLKISRRVPFTKMVKMFTLNLILPNIFHT